MRRRLPLLVFILLAVICLLMLGLACACATDHPKQNIDSALGAFPAARPLIEMWSFAIFAVLGAAIAREMVCARRLSPVLLQRLTL